jgi:hypothetical protein
VGVAVVGHLMGVLRLHGGVAEDELVDRFPGVGDDEPHDLSCGDLDLVGVEGHVERLDLDRTRRFGRVGGLTHVGGGTSALRPCVVTHHPAVLVHPAGVLRCGVPGCPQRASSSCMYVDCGAAGEQDPGEQGGGEGSGAHRVLVDGGADGVGTVTVVRPHGRAGTGFLTGS